MIFSINLKWIRLKNTAHPMVTIPGSITLSISTIRNGTPVFQDPTFGFRAAAPALLTNISLEEQRVVEWNPVNMRIPS